MRTSLLLAAAALPLAAYNPPVDTAGPLTARIDGPSVVSETGTAIPVSVRLDNRGAAPLTGNITMCVADAWTIAPQTAAFRVEPNGTQTLSFTLTAGPGTYNAHYPVHAFAEFTSGGAALVAHPVLIVETKLPDPPRARPPVPWAPQRVEPDSGVALWRMLARRTVIEVFGKPSRATDVAWEGVDPQTHANAQFAQRIDRGGLRDAVTIHPPWYGGQAGTALVEYPLALPKVRILKLRFANAIRDNTAAEGASDGVTFRVRVLPFDAPAGQFGEIVFERHTAAKTWQEGEADLTAFAGRAIRLQLESHPGPKHNTTSDSSYWAEPVLIAGAPPAPVPFPPPAGAAWRSIGKAASCDVRAQAGRRGMLDGVVAFACPGGTLYMRGFHARVLGDALEDWRSCTAFLGASEETVAGRHRVVHRFRNWAGEFDLVSEMWTENGALRAAFRLENAPAPRPWLAVYLEDAAAGAWSERASRVYLGVGNVLEEPAAFHFNFDGHRLATSFVGFDFPGLSIVQAVDSPPSQIEVDPAARAYTLHTPHQQTMSFIPARDAWSAAMLWRGLDSRRAASGVPKLAGRFVFDLWGGRYATSAAQLERAFRYGLTDSVVVWHNWQRWGYDYRLPDIWPPNPNAGTEQEFVALAERVKRHGAIFAPHDNYIDYYPDADKFSYDQIAFTPAGAPVRAWFNEGRQAQSYRWRPDRIAPFVERNLQLIRTGAAPTGYFIDVWSSMGPHDYWTRDGRFFDRLTTRRIWGETFAWIRNFLGSDAPQISESGHDQLIGYLDGAQTNHLRVDPGQPRWAWPVKCADAERIPWIDAVHHQRFALHGAGYENRYAGGLDPALHGIYSDDYIATEVLTGHPAMVKEAFSRDAVRKYWLLHDLMRSLALARMEAFEFDGGNIHRQHVRWSNGAEIWVNRGAEDWTAAGHVLPQYGFYARVASQGIEAAIERRDGIIVDWSRSRDMEYANARPVVSDRLPARVSVESVRATGARRIEARLRWNVRGAIPEGARVFVHYVDKDGEILFQGSHPVLSGPGETVVVSQATVPETIKPGTPFDMRIGFYFPAGGARVLPEGPDDGTRRIRMGTLRWDGASVSWTPQSTGPDPSLARYNPGGKAVRFGAAATNGAARISRDGQATVVTPLPGGPAFELRLRVATPNTVEALDESGHVLAITPARVEAGEVVIQRDPAVFAYRIR